MHISVEPLQEKDVEQTIKLIQKTITLSYKTIYPQELIESFCSKYSSETFGERMKIIDHFVAKNNNGTVIGVLGLQENQRLRSFYVDPEMQGKGVGRMLYECVEKEARKRGAKKLSLEGSPLGEPAYKRFGFTKIRTVEKHRAGIPFSDAYMEKEFD